MTDPIRVLHFADVHIGMENFGKTDEETGLSSRVLDFLHRMDEMTAYVRQHGVDLVVFAGDAFKTSTPNPTYQRGFAHRIKDLAELAPVVMLVGNHDLQPNKNKASSIEIYDTLDVPNVRVLDDFSVTDINTARGRVVVGSAPYPVRSRLMEKMDLHGKTIKQVDDYLQETLVHILDELAGEADRLAGADVPRLLTGHFTVAGALLGSERSVMLGRDVQMPIGVLADSRWDYVAMGHIHKHQNLTQDREGVPPIVYSGSIERVDFGEEGDAKGFCYVQLGRENTAWQFVEVNTRPMVTIYADCRQDRTPTQTVLRLIKNYHLREAIVRVRVELTPETEALFKDEMVRDELRRAGVYHIAAIEHRLERPERSRLGVSPEGLSNEQLLEQYLKSKQVDAPRRETLLELARELMGE
jgi:exonuclease SbcD